MIHRIPGSPSAMVKTPFEKREYNEKYEK